MVSSRFPIVYTKMYTRVKAMGFFFFSPEKAEKEFRNLKTAAQPWSPMHPSPRTCHANGVRVPFPETNPVKNRKNK